MAEQTEQTDEMKPRVAQMLERARESLATELEALDLLSQRAISAAIAAETYDLKLGSHVAWIASKRAEIVSHLRQLEKHDRVMSKSPEQRFRLIFDYLRTEATPPQRTEVLALLVELEQGRSVLS